MKYRKIKEKDLYVGNMLYTFFHKKATDAGIIIKNFTCRENVGIIVDIKKIKSTQDPGGERMHSFKIKWIRITPSLSKTQRYFYFSYIMDYLYVLK